MKKYILYYFAGLGKMLRFRALFLCKWKGRYKEVLFSQKLLEIAEKCCSVSVNSPEFEFVFYEKNWSENYPKDFNFFMKDEGSWPHVCEIRFCRTYSRSFLMNLP